jgi:NADH:ubiquinone oxidoreductase subunit F (NADH-binding)
VNGIDTRVAAARLLLGPAPGVDWSRHLALHGPLPPIDRWSMEQRRGMLAEIERSGLTGRGGACFPSSRKHLAVQRTGRPPLLIVNAMEGEPASAKDRVLLEQSPHLVLDGAEVLATALGARRIALCLPSARDQLVVHVRAAVASRPVGPARIEVLALPGRYIAGEESALAAAAAGKAGLPTFRPDKSAPLSVGRSPALVHNTETLAHLALIARHGADWFRSAGTGEAPGTTLVTVSGAVERAGVDEVELGTPLRDVLALAAPTQSIGAVLVGGFGGTFVGAERLDVPYSPAGLGMVGAAPGAGVLVVFDAKSCGLREAERIIRFLAHESAGQCGPCLFGLPAIADDLALLAAGVGGPTVLDRLQSRCAVVEGRGGCRHPDGAVRLVRSALAVFSNDLTLHLRGATCSDATHSVRARSVAAR